MTSPPAWVNSAPNVMALLTAALDMEKMPGEFMVITPEAFALIAPPAVIETVPVPLIKKGLLMVNAPVLNKTSPSVIVTGPAKVEMLPAAPADVWVKVFPGELNTIDPVPAVKLKSSLRTMFRSLPAIFKFPDSVMSDPIVVLAFNVNRPEEVLDIVVPLVNVKVPATEFPDASVVVEEVELFV